MGKHDTDQTIRDMERLASLLDDRFRVPGTSLRFGLDSLLGLIPGVGDTLSGAVAFYMIYRAYKLGVPRSLLLGMSGNLLLDWLAGLVPVLGDLLDFALYQRQGILTHLMPFIHAVVRSGAQRDAGHRASVGTRPTAWIKGTLRATPRAPLIVVGARSRCPGIASQPPPSQRSPRGGEMSQYSLPLVLKAHRRNARLLRRYME